MTSSRPDMSAEPSTSLTYQRKYVSQKAVPRVAPILSHRQLFSIRLYSAEGDRSTVASISRETTCQQISENYKVDAVYVQTGNLHIRCLPPDEKPLIIYCDYLNSIGFRDVELRTFGAENDLRSIIAFFLGRPVLNPTNLLKNEILLAECLVRRGTLLHKWHRYKCVLYNGTIRIQKDTGEDEVLHLNRLRVDLHETRRGRCLRVSDVSGSGNFTLFRFDDQETLLLWLTRSQQNLQTNSLDLSDQRLTLLPETLFSVGCSQLQKLNLRRNSLTTVNERQMISQLGFLDDLLRLQSLTFLDISSNKMTSFPESLTQLSNLVHLNLSSNQISDVSPNIKNMTNLNTLDLSNNMISNLPLSLAECSRLTSLNIAFNKIKEVPLPLTRMRNIKHWLFSGNRIERIDTYYEILDIIEKIDLSRNCLDSTFRLPTGRYSNLTFLDLRDNHQVSAIYLTNLSALQIFYCSRLQLTALYLSGQSLVHLQADHNLLDTVVIMPIPSRLQYFDVSHNQIEHLPDWLPDLQQLHTLRAHHNRLSHVPKGMFCMPNLRIMALYNNSIVSLPNEFHDPSLDTLLIQNNELEQLPPMLFQSMKRLRHFNASNNRLNIIPLANSHIDSNRIQILRLSSNELDENIVPTVVSMKRLKILDLSNNRLRYFDDSALTSLTLLEEINISNNLLTAISASIPQLCALTTLRAHSNQIQKMPDLSPSLSLQLVDLSNNHLSQFHPSFTTATNLRFLDVTCNSGLQVDSGTLRHRRKQVSLVNIGSEDEHIQVGFSETTGAKSRLCIRRLRHGNIIGIVDGGTNYELPKSIIRIMLELIEADEHIELKKLILNTHLRLGEEGERLGASVTVIRLGHELLEICSSGGIGTATIANDNTVQLYLNSDLDDREYNEIRRHGHIVDENNLINGLTTYSRQLGLYYLHPAVVPDPISYNMPITDIDYVILASRALWDHIILPSVVDNVCRSLNPQVASKRLQDCLQSCDYNGNSSITVIRLKKPEQVFHSPSISLTLRPSLTSSDYNQPHKVSEETFLNNDLKNMDFPTTSFNSDSDFRQNFKSKIRSSNDDGYVSGRQLYQRILESERKKEDIEPTIPTIAPPPPPPPDPTSSDVIAELHRTFTAKRLQTDYNTKIVEKVDEESHQFSPRSPEGKYSVTEETKQFLEQKGVDVQTRAVSRKLTVIEEDKAEDLVLDDVFSFSHHSTNGSQVQTSPLPGVSLEDLKSRSTLTPVEEQFTNRYRFEYAVSSPQMEITREVRRSGLNFNL